MATRRVFLLNLDADLELGAMGRYAPTRSVLAAMQRARRPLMGTLVPEGSAIAEESSPAGSFEGWVGVAFCPTRSALRTLDDLGASVPEAPSHEVLRTVARREFGYLEELEGSLVTEDGERVLEHLRAHASTHVAMRIKRSFGMAGRGHRVVRGMPTAADEAFVRATRSGGLIVEPEVSIERELGLHGYLRANGSYVSGAPCVQVCDAQGAWVETRRLERGEREPRLVASLERSLAEAAELLAASGYFGPFGVDAFEYASGAGTRLRARSEIHARYSMGWPIGMGATRPDLDSP